MLTADEDIRPISYIKTHISDIVSQVNDTHRPLYVTQNGKAKAVVLDTKSYEDLVSAINILRFISPGINDVKSKRYTEHDKFVKTFNKKHFNK